MSLTTGAGVRCQVCNQVAAMSQPGKGLRFCWKHFQEFLAEKVAA